MTFLPIVARELRVASRRRWTYWSRFSAALLALMVAAVVLLANDSPNQNDIGLAMFITLAILVFFYVAILGTQLTCDCLSAERREGTLGLLFLTDLRGYDVVFGKLAATSLHAFYSVIALLPVLAIPLLLGGVANAEVWRVALVAANLLFFFLSVGIFSSSVCREDQRALALSVFISLSTVLLWPVLDQWMSLRRPAHQTDLIWLPCPAFGCGAAFDEPFKQKGWPALFWCNAAITQAYSWTFLFLACWIVPRSWQESAAGPKRGKWRDLWRLLSQGSAASRAASRLKMLGVNPFLWRAGRPRSKYVGPWVFLALVGIGWFAARKMVDRFFPTDFTCAVSVHFVFKMWLAAEACRCFAEDRRTGGLELLLTTPLGAGQIVRGQRKALWRQFAAPVAAVLLVEMFYMLHELRHERDWENRQGIFVLCLIPAAFLVADMLAVSWLSMRLALTGRKPIRVIMLSIWWAVLLPNLLSLGITIVWVTSANDISPLAAGLIWAIPSLAADSIIFTTSKMNMLDRLRLGALAGAGNFRPAR
ncbi:MAG TPA: ABC transporter permease subunit [Candidatus Acidoferrum sp.]|nr:ABC transporter permease subunit [Candidatus Acidoferrum sp.]